MNSIFNSEDAIQQDMLEKLAMDRRRKCFGEIELTSALSLVISDETTIEGVATLYEYPCLEFTAPGKSVLLSLAYKRLEPFEMLEPSGSVTKLGFTICGAAQTVEFIVQS
jgi:hypothetical protein